MTLLRCIILLHFATTLTLGQPVPRVSRLAYPTSLKSWFRAYTSRWWLVTRPVSRRART